MCTLADDYDFARIHAENLARALMLRPARAHAHSALCVVSARILLVFA